MVIADNAAIIVDGIFNQYASQSSIALVIGMVLFAFQIYCDFSGYSDIAIGLGRLFGFDLMTNFKFPYLSRDISEFWKRWHISLSTWFRDYLYIPLGGSRVSQKMALRNIFIVFLVSGFWHGANWTFITWGAIHGLLYVPIFLGSKKKQGDSSQIAIFSVMKVLFTFTIVCLAWVFFRASSLQEAINYLMGIAEFRGGSNFAISINKYLTITLITCLSIIGLMGVETYFYQKKQDEVRLPSWMLLMVCLAIFMFGAFKNPATFIYFQF